MKNKFCIAAAFAAVSLSAVLFAVPAYAQGNEPAVDTPAESPAVEKPFTPPGTGTVVDNATDEDGKEFYTIQTPNENVFYLVIDRQRTGENVYFLNAVTEQDLMALAETDAKAETPKPGGTKDQAPEVAPKPTPEPTPAPEQKPGGGNMGTILLVLAVALIGGGAGWYFKIYRPKHGIPELEEDESEFEDEDGGELPPWDEDEPKTEQETEEEE